jgi:hypothetical protein
MVLKVLQRDIRRLRTSKTDEGQIEGSVGNQPKRRLTMFRTKREPAPPAKTGLFRTKKQPVLPAKPGLFRRKREPAPPMKTGLISKVKTLLSSQKEMARTMPKVKKPIRRR